MVGEVKRIERIRVYPSARQKQAPRFMLDVTCQLYNAALQERRDAGFGIHRRMIGEKAECAVRRVVDVAAKRRRRRRFACIACGFTLHADVNTALVIRGRARLAQPYPAADAGPRTRCAA
jgi:transposase